MNIPLKKSLLLNLCLFFWVITAVVIISCSKKVSDVTKTNGGTTVTTNTNFTIQDSRVLDPDGKEFIARGINVNGPYWPWPRPVIPDVSLITDIWKFNVVRVDCYPSFSIYNSNNTDLDGIVNAFTAKKVVVIIENHDFTGTYPTGADLDKLTAWWVGIANKYKNMPYVWFNIMNEPGGPGPAPVTWLNVHETVINAIRNTGATNIIVCDEHAYGQANGYDNDASSGILTYGPTLTAKYKNILFSLHTYDAWIYADNRLKNYINAVQSKKLALIIGEYGTGNNYSSEVTTSVFKNAIPQNIGRIGWQWTGVDIHKLVTTGEGGGFDINNTSGSKPTNLSFVGNLIWDDNHSGIDLGGQEIIPPAVLVSNTDFEDDNPINGAKLANEWINFGTAYLDNTPQNVKHGSFSVLVQSGAAGGFGQPIYLQPGSTYKMTAWGKNNQSLGSASSIGIKYQTVFNGSDTQLASLDFNNSGYEQKSVTFTTPQNLAGVFLFIYKNDASAIFWCDDIEISKM